MEKTRNNVRKSNTHKRALMARSQLAKAFIKKQIAEATSPDQALAAASLGVNDVLMMWHREETGQSDFRTFGAWKAAGFKVKAKETSYRIWGTKRKNTSTVEAENITTGESEDLETTYEFWPMCCLFHAGQVEPLVEQQEDAA